MSFAISYAVVCLKKNNFSFFMFKLSSASSQQRMYYHASLKFMPEILAGAWKLQPELNNLVRHTFCRLTYSSECLKVKQEPCGDHILFLPNFHFMICYCLDFHLVVVSVQFKRFSSCNAFEQIFVIMVFYLDRKLRHCYPICHQQKHHLIQPIKEQRIKVIAFGRKFNLSFRSDGFQIDHGVAESLSSVFKGFL